MSAESDSKDASKHAALLFILLDENHEINKICKPLQYSPPQPVCEPTGGTRREADYEARVLGVSLVLRTTKCMTSLEHQSELGGQVDGCLMWRPITTLTNGPQDCTPAYNRK